MVQEGPVNVCFNAQSYGVDVAFDPQTQEQRLSFRFAVSVSLPQLLQQLIEIQKQDGAVLPMMAPTSQRRTPGSSRAETPPTAAPAYLTPTLQAPLSGTGSQAKERKEMTSFERQSSAASEGRGQFAIDVQLLECVQRHETVKARDLIAETELRIER
ncbi:unnamed protein product [Durusdinium trenchii]|uniref:Uncharacterized protein n=1 Tax=Durusdinium trenchii TaxID=1381693 RepID=A0ABP0IJ00_9DINO